MDPHALVSGPLADVVDPAPLVSSERVYAGRVWDVVAETVTFAGGEMTREFIAHTGAVAVLAIDADDNVLLINQYRQPIGTRDWEIPAGLLDVEGEPPLEAARRELAEETDLVAAEWEPLLSYHPSPGGMNEIVHIFEARALSAAPDVHDRVDEEREIVLRWAPLDEVIEAVLDGRLRNGPLVVAVLAARVRRDRRRA